MLLGPRSYSYYSQLKDASDVHQKSSSLFDIWTELVKSFLKHFTLPNLESNHLYLSTIYFRPPNEIPPNTLIGINRCNHKISASVINIRMVNNTTINNDIRLSIRIVYLKCCKKIILDHAIYMLATEGPLPVI